MDGEACALPGKQDKYPLLRVPVCTDRRRGRRQMWVIAGRAALSHCSTIPQPQPLSLCTPPPCPLTQLFPAHPQPREETPPAPSMPFSKSSCQFLVFLFPAVKHELHEQSPLLCLPSLAYVLIRSCRYPAVICLVSPFTQTRLGDGCCAHYGEHTSTPSPGYWEHGRPCWLLPPSSLMSRPGWESQAARAWPWFVPWCRALVGPHLRCCVQLWVLHDKKDFEGLDQVQRKERSWERGWRVSHVRRG